MWVGSLWPSRRAMARLEAWKGVLLVGGSEGGKGRGGGRYFVRAEFDRGLRHDFYYVDSIT